MNQNKIESLEESLNNFEILFHSTRDIVAVVDRHLHIVMINQAGVDTFGYTEEEIYNLTVEDFTEPNNGNVIRLLRRFKSCITFELDLYTKEEKVVNLLVKGKDITYKGKPARVIILTNVTETKKSQQNLVNLNRSLEERVAKEVEKNRQKDKQMLAQSRLAQMGEMISMIAHQWRQPLGAIASTNIDMKLSMMMRKYDLEQESQREEFHGYMDNQLNDIEKNIQNLTVTIDDFRDFYKPNRESEEITICTPLEKSLDILKGTLESQGVVVIKSLESEKKLKLFNNELMQVYINIIKNSMDNFKEKEINNGSIMIESRDINDGVKLTINDNGGGISEENIPKIFDPYFSTKYEKNGTGLGLYMSKMIVEEQHKGKLKVENIDDGVHFSIEIYE